MASTTERVQQQLRVIWAWRGLAAGPIALIVAAGILAWIDRNSSSSSFPTGVMAALSGLLTAQTFLTTLGLTLGRAEPYRRAVDTLKAEDDRVEELSKTGGTVCLDDLYLLVAFPAYVKANLLKDAMNPATRPRISRKGHAIALRESDERRRQAETQLYGRPLTATEAPTDAKDWVESVLSHTRASEARIALICYLGAGVIGLTLIGAGSAGWHWAGRPAPEFYAVVAICAASICVCAMALIARHELMNEVRSQLGEEQLPFIHLAVSLDKRRLTRSDAEVLFSRSPDSRFARLILAAAYLDFSALHERDWHTFGFNRVAPYELKAPEEVTDARDLLAKLIDRRIAGASDGATWRWRSPDVCAAILRVRVGELLGEDAAALSELSSEAVQRLTRRTRIAGNNAWSPFGGRPHLLPAGWKLGSIDTFEPDPEAARSQTAVATADHGGSPALP